MVKLELLNFGLRGPGMGLLALGIISAIDALPHVLGIQGGALTPFAVVGGILLWQWLAHLALPWLGKTLIYDVEGAAQLTRLEELNERLLTRRDLLKLLEAVLATICDSLQAKGAAIHEISAQGSAELARAGELAEDAGPAQPPSFPEGEEDAAALWHDAAWWLPLYRAGPAEEQAQPPLIGALQLHADERAFPLSELRAADLRILTQRAERALSDLILQAEMFATVAGILPRIALTGSRAVAAAYRLSRDGAAADQLPERAQVIALVRAALRHYWGGRGLYQSALQELAIVRARLTGGEYNPARALREVLEAAIERQRPDGERQLTAPEWTLYNILVLRFIERRKVREVAARLALSEPDLYRKQRLAIEVVADEVLDDGKALAGRRN